MITPPWVGRYTGRQPLDFPCRHRSSPNLGGRFRTRSAGLPPCAGLVGQRRHPALVAVRALPVNAALPHEVAGPEPAGSHLPQRRAGGPGVATPGYRHGAHARARLRWAFARTDTVFYVATADNAASLHLHSALGFQEVKRFGSDRSAAGVDVLSQLVRSTAPYGPGPLEAQPHKQHRRTAVNCNPALDAFGAGMEDAGPVRGRDPWSASAVPLRHVSPDALPMSAVSAREPDGAHAIG
jgi:hypothetical protein